MPFDVHGNRAFTEISILKNAPAASGVYGLSNAREWIYVGESDNLQLRLLAHVRKMEPAIAAQAPTGFTYELCLPSDRIGRQNRLVQELEPVHNRRVSALKGASA